MPIRIFIDQGHNPSGPNAGAEGNGLREQDVNYLVGERLAQLLNRDPRFTARVSRTTPVERLGTSNATSLQARVNMANAWPADYFLSIHCNASTNPDINGSEVYVYREGSQAYWLAQHILKALVKSVGTRDNGVRLNPSGVLRPGHLQRAAQLFRLRPPGVARETAAAARQGLPRPGCGLSVFQWRF